MTDTNGREPSLATDNGLSGREPSLGGDKKPRHAALWLTADGTIIMGDPYSGVGVEVCREPSLLISPNTEAAFNAYVVSNDFKPLFLRAEKIYTEKLKVWFK